MVSIKEIYGRFKETFLTEHRETYDKVANADLGWIGIIVLPVGYITAIADYFVLGSLPITLSVIIHTTLFFILGLMRKGKIPPRIYQNLFVFLYFSIFFTNVSFDGGSESHDIFWLAILPIVAGSFLPRKVTILWSAFSLLSLFYFFSNFSHNFVMRSVIAEKDNSYFLISTLAMIVCMTIISLVTETNRLKIKIEKDEALTSANRSANLASLGELAGGIAHEINNPLMIIGGSALALEKAIKKDPIDLPKIEKHCSTIKRTTNRAATIIKGLKNLSRDGADDLKEIATIGEILEEVLSFMRAKIRIKDIELVYDERNPLFKEPLTLYRVQFSQVVLNLIVNSMDALDDLDITNKKITIDMVEKKDGSFNLKFMDSGPGIPENVQEKMFSPFYTTKPVGKGTGLGLSLCFTMIQKTGGKLYYDKLAPSTCFIVHLPKELRIYSGQKIA